MRERIIYPNDNCNTGANVKIGFPNHPREEILKEIEWIGKNRFDFIDIFLEEDKATPEQIRIKKTKELLDYYKLDRVGHTAWYLPIGSPVKEFRQAARKEAKKYFEVFSQLEVKYVTVHGNWPSTMFTDEEGIKYQVETLERMIDEAKKYNLSIMYESIDTPRDNATNVAKILNALPELYFHLDIGHANIHGRKPEEFVKAFSDRLKHIHLHDNNGKEDLHLPMGTGNINWPEFIKTLKENYDGTITLEIFSKDKDYALLSKEKLRKMWDLA